jgi:DNA-binding LacI/PurR family transcriptional regulator
MAFAVMDVARGEFGLRIPRDLLVIGYDDVPEAAWKAYDLTTVSQSSEKMVVATAKILLEQIEKSFVKKRTAVLPAELVIRGSARLPKVSRR